KIEGRPRGYPEMILLNQFERVAETGGSCVFIVRDGTIATPPASEGCLESITVEIAECLAEELGMPVIRRPIDRSELYIADEIALVGTLAEITPVLSVDGHSCTGSSNLLGRLADRYFDAVKGICPHRSTGLSCRHYEKVKQA